MKSWTDPTCSFPWRETHPLARQGKKRVTNSRAAVLKSWMVKCSPSQSGILVEAINTKILTKNHPDSSHSHTDSPHSHHLDYPCSHPVFRVLTLISRIHTLIPRVFIFIPCVPIIPLILFTDSPFRLLQIVSNYHLSNFFWNLWRQTNWYSCKKVNIWTPSGYFPFSFHFSVEMK